MRILKVARFLFGLFSLILLSFTLSGCGSSLDGPVPTIASFSPATGVAGSTVTITGTGFRTDAGSNIIKFNGTTATVTSSAMGSIVTTVPVGATTGKITVTIGSDTATSATDYTVTVPPSPTITSFTPLSGVVGATVTITGTNFSTTTASNTVSFNGTLAAITGTPTATSIVTVVPAGATTGKITVAVAGAVANATSAADFTVAGATDPTISSFTPASGFVGTTVTITGTNFSTTPASNTVKFNNTTATVSASTATSLTTTVPSGATTGAITVAVGGVTATSATNYTVTISTDPTITSFTPASGAVGDTVTITGTNFSTTQASNTVKFNNTTATVSASTATSITTTVPTGATTGTITVAVAGVTATSATSFTVATPWTAKTYTFDDPHWVANADGILVSAPTPTSLTPSFADMSSPVIPPVYETADGLTYYSRIVANSGTTAAALRYRYIGAASLTGSTINMFRPSVIGTITATDLGADSGLNGYVALAIPAGVTNGTVAISFKATTATLMKVAIVGSNATPGSGTTNVILASTPNPFTSVIGTVVPVSTGSISLAGYTHIKVIFSREGLTSGGIDIISITVGP